MHDQKPSILIIDDEEGIREYLRYVLETAGYLVSEAINGKDGLRQIERTEAEIIITDLCMPEMEGLEMIKIIKARNHLCGIIALSGATNSDTYLEIAKHMGAHAVLEKPIDRTKLLAMIEAVYQQIKSSVVR